MTETWMTGREASEYLAKEYAISANHETLCRYRHFGRGPQYEMRGRFIRYSRKALDEWAREKSLRIPVRSTAEARRLQEMKAAESAAA